MQYLVKPELASILWVQILINGGIKFVISNMYFIICKESKAVLDTFFN